MLGLYRFATVALGPVIAFYLEKRKAQGKEDPIRFGERLGQAGRPRPSGPVVWVHAASVGESLSMLTLIDGLLARDPDLHVLVTTGTVTSAKLMAERLPERAFHQYMPVDRPAYVRAFLNHWHPCAALWAESEFWPNMLMDAQKRRIPMVLINGRISDKSFKTWTRFSGSIKRLLGGFDLALGQTEDDAARLSALGAPTTDCLGNLKFSAPPLPCDEDELARLRGLIGDRPVWLAASTHAGEEEMAGRVHSALKTTHPNLLTIIVPRHAPRGDEVTEALRTQGLTVAQRCAKNDISSDTEVYVADTIGELGLFFRLAPLVFMGKSLLARGGQNPLEPAALGACVLFGPHMDNFVDLSARMLRAGAARQVADEAALTEAVAALLDAPTQRQTLSEAGQTFASGAAGVADRVIERLGPILDAACGERS